MYKIPKLPLPYDLETKAVLKQLNKSNKILAELKGLAATISNEQILISSLTLQEAKESSEVENIVTTQDDLYRASVSINQELLSAATKEVLNYREALQHGFNLVRKHQLLTNNVIQFESIHPFYDGNGRTGRIVNVLYLVQNNLLDLPILYLSRYITRNKADYYRLIQAIRDKNTDNASEWEAWVLFMLRAVEVTASDTIALVKGIGQLMGEYKKILRPQFGKYYKHELLNNLFFHPYTKLEFFQRDMAISRQTAAKYLDKIVETGLLEKIRIGRENYYVNKELMALFLAEISEKRKEAEPIESMSE